jgi:hypothetical protein
MIAFISFAKKLSNLGNLRKPSEHLKTRTYCL